MPNYVSEALHKFQHPAPYRPEHAPHAWTKPAYGQRQQFVTPHNDSDLLDQDGINRVQQVVGIPLLRKSNQFYSHGRYKLHLR